MRAVALCALTLAGALAVPALASAYVPPVRECGVYQVPRGPLVYNLTTRDYSCNTAAGRRGRTTPATRRA